MATAHELANRALMVLGEPRIGFGDPGATAALVRDLFPITFRKHLTDEDWYWARARLELTEVTGLTHLTGFEYVFDLPTDMLRPIALYNANGALTVYLIERQYLFTDDSDPVMLYTADCLETDASGWPQIVAAYEPLIPDYWVESFAYTLAADLAFPISRDEQLAQRIRGEGLFFANARAKQINAMASPGLLEPEADWGGQIVSDRRHPRRT